MGLKRDALVVFGGGLQTGRKPYPHVDGIEMPEACTLTLWIDSEVEYLSPRRWD